MADRHTTVFGDQIDVTALGVGLGKDGSDNLKVLVDDSTVEIATLSGIGDAVQVKDAGITEPKLDASNSPTDEYVLSWDSGAGQFTWVPNLDTDAVLESDIVANEIPTGLINSLNVTYTIANTPVTGSVMVFLNGLLQAPGGGLDYTISGTTITFVKAPRTNSDLYVSYFIDN